MGSATADSDHTKGIMFPDYMYGFPRQQWEDVTFVYPIFYHDEGDHGFKVNYAARLASRRWAKSLLASDATWLTRTDYALVLFDKVDELNHHMRNVARDRAGWRTTENWLILLDKLLECAHRMGLYIIRKKIPDPHQYPELECILADDLASDIRQFVFSAMGSLWICPADSAGDPPGLAPYDHAFVNKYIPPPEMLPPRPFTKPNFANPQAKPNVTWLDHNLNPVPPPRDVAMPYMDGDKWFKGRIVGEEVAADPCDSDVWRERSTSPVSVASSPFSGTTDTSWTDANMPLGR